MDASENWNRRPVIVWYKREISFGEIWADQNEMSLKWFLLFLYRKKCVQVQLRRSVALGYARELLLCL